MSPDDPTDHDLLLRLDERVGQLLNWTKSHDYQHAVLREDNDKSSTSVSEFREKTVQRVKAVETRIVIIYAALATVGAAVLGVVIDLLIRR